ncbi:helix-turn-helix domain-containing protein [Klebsiella pneumoniae]|uniref:helix-turn-helix domain-containing protein n=1 Tax=Klebsiella pneumoniae TaxID=573 RepID=UPI0039B37551|nr:helix-turn-helix transcriptional regulator [Klebsiella pneumoniae]HCB3981498.1 helix-turn-helix transcriptional regulator [Klebsiella pneumoniae]
MKLSEKVRAIREAEGLSQSKFCEIIGLSISTLKKYESGNFEPGGNALVKITTHPIFNKYTLWLMTDKTAPEVGQVSPAIVHTGQNATESAR